MDMLPRSLLWFSTGSAPLQGFYGERGIIRDAFELSPVSRQFIEDQLLGLN